MQLRVKTMVVKAAPLLRPLQKRIWRIQDWRRLDRGIEIAEFEMERRDGKQTTLRRYVVVRQEIAERPKAPGKPPSLFKDLEALKNYRFSAMVTNDRKLPAEDVWREYRTRANDENVLKDLKAGCGFAAFNLNNFWATEAVMLMNALVFHNLVHYLNRNILNPNQSQKQLKTLRARHFILPAQLGNSAGAWVLRLGVRGQKLRGRICHILEKIMRIPHRLNGNAVAAAGS